MITGTGTGTAAVVADFFGGAAITKTSLDIRNSLGAGGAFLSSFQGLGEARSIAEEGLTLELVSRMVRASKETLELEPKVGVFGILGDEGIEAYASISGRCEYGEKRSKALRLAHSSLGAAASVAVERDARLTALLLLERSEEVLSFPSESRRRMVFLNFFSTLAGSEKVDEAKLCMVKRWGKEARSLRCTCW